MKIFTHIFNYTENNFQKPYNLQNLGTHISFWQFFSSFKSTIRIHVGS